MFWGDFIIPRLPLNRSLQYPDNPRSICASVAGSGSTAQHCIYCRNFHSLNSYCFQRKYSTMADKRSSSRRVSYQREETSSDSSDTESGEISGSGSGSGSGSDSGSVNGEGTNVLKDFYSSLERVDNKEVTLTLAKQSVKLYFETVLGRGKFDKEGREKMRDKYYLTVKQFEKFAPPDLMGTKLHVLDGLDFSGLSSRLQTTHSKLREVVKVLLKNFQTVGELTSIFGELQLGEVYNGQGELHPDYELSALEKYTADDPDIEGSLECTEANFKAILLENSALRRKDADTVIMYRLGILIV